MRDGDAPRLRDRGVPPGRRAAARRGLRRRRRELPAQVLRRHRRVQEPGRHDPLRLARRPGGRAALRAVDPPLATARRRSTGRRTRRSSATGACSQTSSTRPSGARACASGARARPRSAAPGCSTRTVDEREQFLAGEPLALEVELAAHAAIAPPLLHLEVRDDDRPARRRGCRRHRGRSAGPPSAGRGDARARLDRPPLAFGRFQLRLGLVAADGRTLHQFDDAARVPRLSRRRGAGARPARRNLERRRETGGPMSYKTCPDGPS